MGTLQTKTAMPTTDKMASTATANHRCKRAERPALILP